MAERSERSNGCRTTLQHRHLTAPDSGSGSYSASASTQYAPRYRELTSGESPGAGADGYQGNGSRYGDDGRQSAEWDPRSQGYR